MANRDFWRGKRVLITGGGGFIGSWVVRHLIDHCGLSERDLVIPRSSRCDLADPAAARRAVAGCQIVIHLAAKTGGISFSRANPATQFMESSRIDFNVVSAAAEAGVEKLLAIGNVFAWGSDAEMPLRCETLYDGLPTLAHRGVGLMKRNLGLLAEMVHRQCGLAMGVLYAANAYGPGDSRDRHHAHVIPATIMKCLHDPQLEVWGDGKPTRDFLFVEDLAEALILAAERLDGGQVLAVGSGREVSIREVIETVAEKSGFRGAIHFDTSKAGGDARRCVDPGPGLEGIGFRARTSFAEGIARTVAWYRSFEEAAHLATEGVR